MSDARMIRPRPYVAAIIQARENSERLPGKVFRKVNGRSVLDHVIASCIDAESIHAVVVATPDKRISDIAAHRGAFDFWYRGDENDVLDRYVKAAEWVNADVIVRVTADCPLLDPAVIDLCVEGLENNDICSNVLRRRFPFGMEVEVFHRDILYRFERFAKDDWFRKEHVTYHAYDQPHLYLHKNIEPAKDYSWIKLAVDTEDDLEVVRKVYGEYGRKDYQGLAEAYSGYIRAAIATGSSSNGHSKADATAEHRGAPETAGRL